MGLDICLIKPCTIAEADQGYGVNDCSTTRNPKIIRKFPQYVVEVEEEQEDYAAYGHPEWEDPNYWENHGYIMTDENFYVIDGDDICAVSDEKYYESYAKDLKPGVTVTKHPLKDIPIKKVTVLEVPYQEIGYQRKGANQKFYEDGKWEDPEKCVTTQAELDYDLLHYFSDSPASKGGWGSFTEYTKTDDERRKDFIDNIASKFKEGETAVMYW
jgi:hypothetical protein